MGTLALDLDGTLTGSNNAINPKIPPILKQFTEKKWHLIFLTGRTFTFAYPLLSSLPYPFFVAVQNGASLIEFPTKKVLFDNPISYPLLEEIDAFLQDRGVGYLIEMGVKHQDKCYFTLKHFSAEEKQYLAFRQQLCKEKWAPISTLKSLNMPTPAALKIFAKKEEAQTIAENLPTNAVTTTVIQDPFRPGFSLMHITAKKSDKGEALKRFLKTAKDPNPIVAAGDDTNDIAMLKVADISLGWHGACQEVLAVCDVVFNDLVYELEKIQQRFL